MAKIYAALIRKGIKTLDEVPARLRSTVEALLAANGISAVSEQDEETEEPDETERTAFWNVPPGCWYPAADWYILPAPLLLRKTKAASAVFWQSMRNSRSLDRKSTRLNSSH